MMGPCVRRDDRRVAVVLHSLFTAVLLVCLAAPALAEENLYRAQTIVTGTGEANRRIGFATCLEDVLIKVSGQLRLAGDKRLAPFKADAAKFVREFSYRDEKGGMPKNDEQGTRDRSFVLTAEFDEAAVNGVLAALGEKPGFSGGRLFAFFSGLHRGSGGYVVPATSRRTVFQHP